MGVGQSECGVYVRSLGEGFRSGGYVFFFFMICALGLMRNCCCRRTSYATSAFYTHHSTVIDSTKCLCSSFHLLVDEIHGPLASFTRDQFACVQFSCSTTTRASKNFFTDAREGILIYYLDSLARNERTSQVLPRIGMVCVEI